MITLSPIQGVVDQEGRDLTPAEIVDGGVPIGMKTKARIFVFIQSGAVKMRQAVGVGGEMRRHPVDQHS